VPLVNRDDSVLAVVDTQPGFFAHGLLADDERRQADRVVDRIAWLVGLASLIDVPAIVVEDGAERNGSTDERIV
jgi:nicotinamidase-related amidase